MSGARQYPFLLIADDDRDTRELYRACFDTSGYRTAEAGTGSQAIVSAVEIVPDVLLTDYVLPDVDGITVARRLKADPRTAGISIVMVSGYATPHVEREAIQAGVDRVLLKPCLPVAVLREVSRAMARAGSRATIGPLRSIDASASVRVREEFAALPGLSLTAEQARLVFDLDRDACDSILIALVTEGFLARTPHGAFKRPC